MMDIEFDSNDWDSVRKVLKSLNESETLLTGTTGDGEFIVFSTVSYKNSDDTLRDVLHTSVAQNNGWIRHNYYDPVEFTVETMYERS